MTLEGVDLASHQSDYTYPTNPDFAIPKASGGHSYRNPYLPQQVANARAKHIIVHFYHYMFEPTSGGGDVATEANNFIEACRPYVEPGSAFWLDVEEYPATVGYTGDLGGWIDTFCDLVDRAFGAGCCGIYCATWYLTATGLDKDTRLAKRRFWMASWQEAVPPAHFMAPWDHLTLHQYNADGIDKDRFYGTREQFLALGVPSAAPFQHAEGWLDPIHDDFDWGGAGIIVGRSVRAYNDQERSYYRRTWSAEGGYTDWVKE